MLLGLFYRGTSKREQSLSEPQLALDGSLKWGCTPEWGVFPGLVVPGDPQTALPPPRSQPGCSCGHRNGLSLGKLGGGGRRTRAFQDTRPQERRGCGRCFLLKPSAPESGSLRCGAGGGTGPGGLSKPGEKGRQLPTFPLTGGKCVNSQRGEKK